MGTFAETAIVDYRLSCADQGKQTSNFCFRLQQRKLSCHFLFVLLAVFRKHGDIDMEIWRHINGYIEMETWKHVEMETLRHGDMETWTWTWRHGDIKRKMEAQAILLNPFTVCSWFKRKFFIYKRTKRTIRTWPSMIVSDLGMES
jgi:hypothetical protein